MEREIEAGRSIAIAKRNQNIMAQETGIQSSLSDDDVKQYLAEVITEVRKDANDNNINP
jgi:hypothetical protein